MKQDKSAKGQSAQTSGTRLLVTIISFDLLAIIAAIVLGLRMGRPGRYFEEHQFITWISSLQLVAVSWFTFRTCRMRLSAGRLFRGSPALLWGLISFGFLYMACDEYFLFHEGIDHRIHKIFKLKETALTDRIDDMVIVLYGLVGLYVLWIYRNEIKQYARALPFLVAGFVLALAMIAADAISNTPEFIELFLRRDLAHQWLVWLPVAEDSLKLLAEGIFIAGSATVLLLSRTLGEVGTG